MADIAFDAILESESDTHGGYLPSPLFEFRIECANRVVMNRPHHVYLDSDGWRQVMRNDDIFAAALRLREDSELEEFAAAVQQQDESRYDHYPQLPSVSASRMHVISDYTAAGARDIDVTIAGELVAFTESLDYPFEIDIDESGDISFEIGLSERLTFFAALRNDGTLLAGVLDRQGTAVEYYPSMDFEEFVDRVLYG